MGEVEPIKFYVVDRHCENCGKVSKIRVPYGTLFGEFTDFTCTNCGCTPQQLQDWRDKEAAKYMINATPTFSKPS